jgi:hypothetical protein
MSLIRNKGNFIKELYKYARDIDGDLYSKLFNIYSLQTKYGDNAVNMLLLRYPDFPVDNKNVMKFLCKINPSFYWILTEELKDDISFFKEIQQETGRYMHFYYSSGRIINDPSILEEIIKNIGVDGTEHFDYECWHCLYLRFSDISCDHPLIERIKEAIRSSYDSLRDIIGLPEMPNGFK